MRGRPVTTADAAFLLVCLDQKGAIDNVTSYRAPVIQGKRAGDARALIMGFKKYQLYRMKDAGSDLEFERLR